MPNHIPETDPAPAPRLRRLAGSLALAVLLLGGCAPEAPDTISRETFVQVYVELRVAALDRDDATLAAADRERILSSHGVTGEDLLNFAEVHSQDPAFMRAVWSEIEERLNTDSVDPS